MNAIRAVKNNIRYHGHVRQAGARNWLAGHRLIYADLAAARLSAANDLGDVPWNEDKAAKSWYARVKSRPFRTILAETLARLPPSATSANLSF